MKEDCSKALVYGRWLNEGLCSGSWNNPEMRLTLRFHALEKPAETWRFCSVPPGAGGIPEFLLGLLPRLRAHFHYPLPHRLCVDPHDTRFCFVSISWAVEILLSSDMEKGWQTIKQTSVVKMGSPDVISSKEPTCQAGDSRDAGSAPELRRSPGAGHGNPLQYFAWRIPWTEEPGGLQSIGSQSQTRLKWLHTHTL